MKAVKLLYPIFAVIFFCKYNLVYRYLVLKMYYQILKFTFFSVLANRFDFQAVANDLRAYRRRIRWACKIEGIPVKEEEIT
jgi:hypothetical protein